MYFFLFFVTVSIHRDERWLSKTGEIVEYEWNFVESSSLSCLDLRFGGLLLVVIALRSGSTFLLRLRLRLVAGFLLLAGPLLLALALLLGPLPIAVTPLTVVRLVLAASLSILVLRLVRVLGLGRPGLGFGARTSRP